jgi:hypothetical protein
MALPVPALVGITDTNALASRACNAEFLAPAVIISADSVFTRFGLATSVADTWLPWPTGCCRQPATRRPSPRRHTPSNWQPGWSPRRSARSQAQPAATRWPHSGSGRPSPWSPTRPATSSATGCGRRARNPQGGRDGHRSLRHATDAYGKARQALRVIEPYGTPTVEELAARHLARVRRPLSLDDLAAALEAAGHAVSSAELRDVTSRHPAFRARAGQPALIGIGRIARLSPAAIVSPGHQPRR